MLMGGGGVGWGGGLGDWDAGSPKVTMRALLVIRFVG